MVKINDIIHLLKDDTMCPAKKIAIDDVVTTYSSKEASHKSAWSYLLAAQLRSIGLDAEVINKSGDIHQYDVWLVALPMEFAGSYNLFGGATDEPALRMQRLLDFQGEVFCLNREMPDVGAFAQSRMKSCSPLWAELDIEGLTQKCKDIKTLDSNTFVLGDSHSVSVWQPGSNISRNDGKTLFGVLKEGMDSYIPEGTKHLITYFGNIDIRHHLCRQDKPVESVKKLVKDYFEHLKSLNIKKVSVVKLLPIEFEDRRIPKTGWYKGTPFIGSQRERTQLMQIFNEEVSNLSTIYNMNVIEWPIDWYTTEPKYFADTYMEKPGSVHLSRAYYQYDFITLEKNKALNRVINSLF
jgi:hypothetical protein